MGKMHDIIILGGGPAGLSAALYAGRAKADVLIIEKGNIGGQITSTHSIENYPGGIKGDSGSSLTERMREQATEFGTEIVLDDIISADVSGDIKIMKSYNNEYAAKAVIIAAGAYPRQLGCKGESEHIGMGVSYCATCDGAFFTDLEVYVVGGGDAALEEGVFLTRFARKVTIIHRRDEFRAEKCVIDKAKANEKVHFMLDSVIEEIKGDGPVDEIIVKNVKTGEITSCKADPKDGMFGVFIFTGYNPNSEIWKDSISLDEKGYIITDLDMKTNIPGVYAAGDIRQKSLRQVVTATADGAIAGVNASAYIEQI